MDSDLQTAKDLRAAADYLRTHGWIRFCLGEDGGPRCLVGAILSVGRLGLPGADLFGWRDRTMTYVCPLVRSMGFSWGEDEGRDTLPSAAEWNNAHTLDEVLDRLESAALNLEIKALAAAEKPVEVPVLA